MIIGFKDALIDVPGQGFVHTSLSVKEGRIASFQSKKGLVVPPNLFVVPGFIDEHIHGSDGFDVMDGKRSSLEKIANALPQDGVTSFCPTTMTMDKDSILKALSTIHEEILASPKAGARILGAHLEGPFISPEFKGAQNQEDIRVCSDSLMDEFFQVCPEIKEVTFAYEENGSALLSYLVNKGIVPSIGHSNCPSELLKEGIAKGIRCSTHAYNAMRRFTHRDVGIVGVVLLDERVRCELIADGIHVVPDAIALLYRMKGPEKVILITDSMEAKHLKEGQYQLGGQAVYVKDGAARLADGTLAGSVLTMNQAVKNMKDFLGISLIDAVRLATENPAKNLSLDHEIGSILPNYRADFAIVDQDVNVYACIRDGEIIYRKENYPWLG